MSGDDIPVFFGLSIEVSDNVGVFERLGIRISVVQTSVTVVASPAIDTVIDVPLLRLGDASCSPRHNDIYDTAKQ